MPNPYYHRKDLRVIDENIQARFLVGTKLPRVRFLARFSGCRVANISIGGVCIQTRKSLTQDQITLYLSVKDTGEIEEFPLVARLVHRHVTGRNAYGYGLRFSEPPPSSVRTAIYRQTIKQKVAASLFTEPAPQRWIAHRSKVIYPQIEVKEIEPDTEIGVWIQYRNQVRERRR